MLMTTLPSKSFDHPRSSVTDHSLLDSTHSCVSSNHDFISTVKYMGFQNHPQRHHEYGNCNVCRNKTFNNICSLFLKVKPIHYLDFRWLQVFIFSLIPSQALLMFMLASKFSNSTHLFAIESLHIKFLHCSFTFWPSPQLQQQLATGISSPSMLASVSPSVTIWPVFITCLSSRNIQNTFINFAMWEHWILENFYMWQRLLV